ncbi:MAG: hypothetical protein SOZ42_03180 [Candidatus Enterosoma sp.]|nr:hypothetical protein [Candidatus Enterosoma sp.]
MTDKEAEPFKTPLSASKVTVTFSSTLDELEDSTEVDVDDVTDDG